MGFIQSVSVLQIVKLRQTTKGERGTPPPCLHKKMKSMTGFGRDTADFKDFSITIDVSSVNKKGVEISVSLPREWIALERTINAEAKKMFSRGKFVVAISAEFKNERGVIAPAEQIEASLAALREACEKAGAEFKPNAATILEINRQISAAGGGATNTDDVWKLICPTFLAACENLEKMRETEGVALRADFTARLKTVSALVDAAEKTAKANPQRHKDGLLQRLAQLDLDLDSNDERLLKEVCLFADKCDVSEELTRLKSHISQFLQTMREPVAVGRKLDFICQEMGREINTTASKANNLELTKIAIELKNEMERIREQVQNVE